VSVASDELLKTAEREVIEAAMEWAKEQLRAVAAPRSSQSQRLRTACYMLSKARSITGSIRVADVVSNKSDGDGGGDD
jgi:hypothetical protein